MSLKETRKKIQRTIEHIAATYPPAVYRDELLRIRRTIDAALPADEPAEEKAERRLTQ